MKIDQTGYKLPFIVVYGDYEEEWEKEVEENDLFEAISIAETQIENRGFGYVYDSDGVEVPLPTTYIF